MNSEILRTILGISPFFVFAPILIYTFKKNKSVGYSKWIFLYLIVNMIAGMISFIMWKMGFKNLWVLHIYLIPEFTLLLLSINAILENKYTLRTLALIVFFGVFSIINTAYFQPLSTFNSNGRVLESVIISILFIAILLKLSSDTEVKIIDQPVFWISTGIFVYFTSSIFIFGYSNSILFKNRDWNLAIWLFHAFVVLIQHFLISIGFIKLKVNV